MSRLFERYTEENPPIQCFMRNSKWYQQSGTFKPKGILWHDTGADNPWLMRYVQPDDNDPNHDELIKLIGQNKYGNDWNHGNKDKDAGLNCWVGKLDDGKVTTIQAGPWTKRPWGCGSRKSGYSLNDTHIQWEICEDAKKDKSYFADVYEESVQVSAYLCKLFSIDPNATILYKGIKVPTICCHWDAYNLGCGSGHTDIYDWDIMYDYLGIPKKTVNINDPYNNPIMLRIRADITKAMQEEPTHSDGWSKQDGKWYYYKDGQQVKLSWIKYKGSWYYFGKDGVMVTDWQTIEGKLYYFHVAGDMAQDEWKDGYFLGMTGMAEDREGKWQDDGAGRWFEDSTGWYPKNRIVRIDGEEYRFNTKGYLVE